MAYKKHRESLKNAKRVVVKAGSKVLVESSGRPDDRQLKLLVDELATFHKNGGEVAFVSSGAVGAGLDALGLKTRPKEVQDLQMAAAVGQICLMSVYNDLFRANEIGIGQVLLTHDGLKDRERHLNARNTLLNLIANRIVPIINENDAVSAEEIKFGDNDVLAALVAILIDADALVLLSTTDGLRDEDDNRVSYIEEVDNDVLELVSDTADKLSTGGMASKLNSAQIAAHNGVPVVIADGRKAEVLTRIFAGEDEGTLLFPKAGNISKRKRWIAFFNRAEGRVLVDDGAVEAMRSGSSLLPVGIKEVQGSFQVGAMVDVESLSGDHVASGLVEYASDEIETLKGQKTSGKSGEVIHHDNMVLL
ncbi:glutamate 5-kinase [Pontiellaceae bacterium B12227]|nr:glutamate 5-kinase [Pontiellaceae bacterium B12227]